MPTSLEENADAYSTGNMYHVGCSDAAKPSWYRVLDDSTQSEILESIRKSLSVVNGQGVVYNLGLINDVAVKYGKAINDINSVAMWSLQNPELLFGGNFVPYVDVSTAPVWFNELPEAERDTASQFLREHSGQAGSVFYGMLSEAHARSFANTYGVSIDDTLICARYLFACHNRSLTLPSAQTNLALSGNMPDLRSVFEDEVLDVKKAHAIFQVVQVATTAHINLAVAMEQAYGSNPDKWNMKNPNIVAAQAQFQRHYIRYMYNPRDQFAHAASLLGGSNNQEVRERIVQLMESPPTQAHSQTHKALKRAMIRTASQEYFRCFEKAKTLCKERNAEKEGDLLTPLDEDYALTGYPQDPLRILLLQRKDAIAITPAFPQSKKLASFATPDQQLAKMPFDVVVFSATNTGKNIKSNPMINIHLMADNLNQFNLTEASFKVPSRFVSPHPLLPRGTKVLIHHSVEGTKKGPKALRVGTVVRVLAVTSQVCPMPIYFTAQLLPFGLPKGHELLKSNDEGYGFKNPYDFCMPLDHLIPYFTPGDYITLKLIRECVHVACVLKSTKSPFVLQVLLQLVYKPSEMQMPEFVDAQGCFSNSHQSDDVSAFEATPAEEEEKLAFDVGRVQEIALNIKTCVLNKTIWLETPENPVSLEIRHRFQGFLTAKAGAEGLPLGLSILKQEGSTSLDFISVDSSHSGEHLPAEADYDVNSVDKCFLLFKHKGEIRGGQGMYKAEGGVKVRSLPTLKMGLNDVESEVLLKTDSILNFPSVDVYGGVRVRVTDANRHLFSMLDVHVQGTVSVTSVPREFVECKVVESSITASSLRFDVTVINPHDLKPGMNPLMLQLDPSMILDGLHVGDRVLDLKKHPLYPVGVVLEILREPVPGGLGVGVQNVAINVVFDGSDTVETYPLNVFGSTLIFYWLLNDQHFTGLGDGGYVPDGGSDAAEAETKGLPKNKRRRAAPKAIDWKAFPAVSVIKTALETSSSSSSSSSSYSTTVRDRPQTRQKGKAAATPAVPATTRAVPATSNKTAASSKSGKGGGTRSSAETSATKKAPTASEDVTNSDGVDKDWLQVKNIVAKGEHSSPDEKLIFRELINKFYASLGLPAPVDENPENVPRKKQPETAGARSGRDESREDDSDENGSNEEDEYYDRPFLPSLARMGITRVYVRECVDASKTAMYEVFRRRLPDLFQEDNTDTFDAIVEGGDWWCAQTICDLAIDALQPYWWEKPRSEFAARYWLREDTFNEVLELLGQCLPAELACHLDSQHGRVDISHGLLEDLCRLCFERKDELFQEFECPYMEDSDFEETLKDVPFLRSRLGNFDDNDTPAHWKLLRFLRERVLRWHVKTHCDMFGQLFKGYNAKFYVAFSTLKLHLSYRSIVKWSDLFLSDSHLFPDLHNEKAEGMPMSVFTQCSNWVRRSEGLFASMVQYARAFKAHKFQSPKDLFHGNDESEQTEDSLATPYSFFQQDHETLESIFTEQFLISDCESNMYSECNTYSDFVRYRRTLIELWNVSPPNLRLVLGATTLGLVAYRPIHSTLLILAVSWEKIAPEGLKSEEIMPQNCLNPIITKVLCVVENSKWSDTVEYSHEMKALAWLGVLANGDISFSKKCAVLDTSEGTVRKVETFVASYLRPEQKQIFATLVDPPLEMASTEHEESSQGDSQGESSEDDDKEEPAAREFVPQEKEKEVHGQSSSEVVAPSSPASENRRSQRFATNSSPCAQTKDVTMASLALHNLKSGPVQLKAAKEAGGEAKGNNPTKGKGNEGKRPSTTEGSTQKQPPKNKKAKGK